MSPVHPADVDAFKRRLAPAFRALGVRRAEGQPFREAYALWHAWNAYLATPVDWIDAPRELERGRDLEARLSWLQGPGLRPFVRTNTGPTHEVGAFLGKPTVAELADLLKSKQAERDGITKAIPVQVDAWAAVDAPAAHAWLADLAAANAAFEIARADAQGVIDAIPDAIASVTPIELPDLPIIGSPHVQKNVWDQLIEASKPYVHLYGRIQAAGHPPPAYTIPQPTAPDPDLKAYQAADKATQGIEAAAKTAESYIVPILAIGAGVVLVSFLVRK